MFRTIAIVGLLLAVLVGIFGTLATANVVGDQSETTTTRNFNFGFGLSDERPIQEAEAQAIEQENQAKLPAQQAQSQADAQVIESTVEDRTALEQDALNAQRQQIANNLEKEKQTLQNWKTFWKWFLRVLIPSMIVAAILVFSHLSAKSGIAQAKAIFDADVRVLPSGHIVLKPSLSDNFRGRGEVKVMLPGVPSWITAGSGQQLLPEFFVTAAAKVAAVAELARVMDERTRADTSVSAFTKIQNLLGD